jgi:hypothetical protein
VIVWFFLIFFFFLCFFLFLFFYISSLPLFFCRARLAMADNNPDSQEARLRSVRRRLNFGEANDGSLPTKSELDLKFAEERSKYMTEVRGPFP